MSSRKSQNSILFLATLGVYLGLVLTGATPVLGHAATSRQFDIRDEIEFSDEFDNKPDEETALEVYASALESVFQVAGEIAISHPDYTGGRPYDFDGILRATPSHSFQVTLKNKSVVSRRYTHPFEDIYSAFPHRDAQINGRIGVAFNLTLENFEFTVAFTPDSGILPSAAAASMSSVLPTLKQRQASAARALIYENTQISAKDDQVFIVTRLPRAGLAALLANDAK
ncbi:MAG: hypothetical protein ABI791_14725 [Acidobacteriota bacterium]